MHSVSSFPAVFLYYHKWFYLSLTTILTHRAFIDVLLKNKPNIPEDTNLIYLIILTGVVSFYFVADKQCIVTAHQKNYVISRIRTIVVGFINLVEIAFLFQTRNYLIYLVLQTSQNIIIYLWVYVKAKKEFPEYFTNDKVQKITEDDRNTIVKNTAALILNRAGSLIINCTDNIIIAAFVGVIPSGLYSNYLVIKNMVNTFTSLFTQSLTASIGNLNTNGDNKRLNEVFEQVYFVNYIIYAFCSICYFALIETFIKIWIGEQYCMGIGIAAIVATNFFILGIQKTAEQFKAACGLYWQDRYRVIIEAVINLAISLILVHYCGVIGVLLGTFISNICVTFWLEPLIVYKHALKRNVWIYYKRSMLYFISTCLLAYGVYWIDELIFFGTEGLLYFLCRALVTVVLGGVMLCALFFRNQYFKTAYTIGKNYFLDALKR